jgi:hypothetical protein
MLVLSPIVFSMSLYVALVYSYLYILFTTVTFVFESQYGFRKDLVGLAFIGLGAGQFLGQFAYTWYANKSYRKHTEAGDFKPEHRLESMVIGSFLVPIGLFWYGWSVQANVHWICPIVAMAVFGGGLLVIFVSYFGMEVYAADTDDFRCRQTPISWMSSRYTPPPPWQRIP